MCVAHLYDDNVLDVVYFLRFLENGKALPVDKTEPDSPAFRRNDQ